jgi:hypothetical protein
VPFRGCQNFVCAESNGSPARGGGPTRALTRSRLNTCRPGAARSQRQAATVNFDWPQSPVRLEQRMRRAHRTGQFREDMIFNFCATTTIVDKLRRRLVEAAAT